MKRIIEQNLAITLVQLLIFALILGLSFMALASNENEKEVEDAEFSMTYELQAELLKDYAIVFEALPENTNRHIQIFNSEQELVADFFLNEENPNISKEQQNLLNRSDHMLEVNDINYYVLNQ